LEKVLGEERWAAILVSAFKAGGHNARMKGNYEGKKKRALWWKCPEKGC
jgi:hypothetical protein